MVKPTVPAERTIRTSIVVNIKTEDTEATPEQMATSLANVIHHWEAPVMCDVAVEVHETVEMETDDPVQVIGRRIVERVLTESWTLKALASREVDDYIRSGGTEDRDDTYNDVLDYASNLLESMMDEAVENFDGRTAELLRRINWDGAQGGYWKDAR